MLYYTQYEPRATLMTSSQKIAHTEYKKKKMTRLVHMETLYKQ